MSDVSTAAKHVPPKPQYDFKRNTLPPLLGLLTFTLTIAVLNFQWLFAQVQYQISSKMHMPTISIDTSVSASARPDEAPSLWIPKIDVHAPVIFESSANEGQIQKSLRQGVVHFPMTAVPGENGKVVVFGHSSGQPWAPGNYKFVFTLLNKMQKGDQIVIDFEGTRYIYAVSKSYVVDPYQTSVLRAEDNKPTLALITCTPVGTSNKRLVVEAEQVSPKPASSPKQTVDDLKTPTPKQIPGNAPDFWHSLGEVF